LAEKIKRAYKSYSISVTCEGKTITRVQNCTGFRTKWSVQASSKCHFRYDKKPSHFFHIQLYLI